MRARPALQKLAFALDHLAAAGSVIGRSRASTSLCACRGTRTAASHDSRRKRVGYELNQNLDGVPYVA